MVNAAGLFLAPDIEASPNQEIIPARCSYRVGHVVEAFGAGVAQSIALIRRGVGLPGFIVHGKREFNAALARQLNNTEFYAWSGKREFALVQDARAFLELYDILKAQRPDLIHAHSSKGGAHGRLAAALLRVPCVYTPHSYPFLQSDQSWLNRLAFRLAESRLGKLSTTIACGLEEYAIAGAFSHAVVLVENGVDTDKFLPPNQSRSLEPFTFLSTGRICPQKDFPFFKALAEQREFRDCRFIWISGGPQVDRQILPNLSIWGQRTPAEVAAALREANCYVNTSRWEGLSRGLLEAAATSLPLAFRNAPGNRELALRMPDSFMFNNQQEAIASLLTIWRNVKRDPRYGMANRHVVELSYNARQTQRRIRSVYDGIILSRMLRNEDFSKLHAARQPVAAA